MELRLHPHDWSRPRPDWRAALLLATLVAGFHYDANPGMTEFFGALFGAVLYWHFARHDEP
jgi:hypothetical protein